MSYCRWSTDCDVYAYAGGGYTVHVAKNERTEKPLPRGVEAWKEVVDNYREYYQPIDNEYAGKTYNVETLEEFHQLMVDLRNAGLNIPQYAFDRIEEEMEDEKSD